MKKLEMFLNTWLIENEAIFKGLFSSNPLEQLKARAFIVRELARLFESIKEAIGGEK